MVALTDIPYKFAGPWAQDAASGYVTAVITPTSASPAASQQLGFPPATATDIGAGGTPPNIADFNGLGLYITGWLLWMQAGGPIQYDGAFSTEVTGYPKAALLASTTLPGNYWVSNFDNNVTNPDAGPSANWRSLFANMFGIKTEYTSPTRDLGVVYTNTTGNPMKISVIGTATGPFPNFVILIDGSETIAQGITDGGDACTVGEIVPAGSTYEVTSNPGSGSAAVTLVKFTEFTQKT